MRQKGEFAGMNDFEVVAFLVVLSEGRRVNIADVITSLFLAAGSPCGTA